MFGDASNRLSSSQPEQRKRLPKQKNPFKVKSPPKGQGQLPFTFMKKSKSNVEETREPLQKTSSSALNRSSAPANPDFFARSKSSLSAIIGGSFDDDFNGDEIAQGKAPVNLKNSKPVGAFISKDPAKSDVKKSTSLPSYKTPQVMKGKIPTPPTSVDEVKEIKALLPTVKKTPLKTSSVSRSGGQSTFDFGGSQLQPKRKQSPWDTQVIKTKKIKNPRIKEQANQLKSNNYSYSYGDSKFSPSPEQRKVLDLVLEEKKNIFYTGSAGTGKSVLLKELVSRLIAKHGPNAVAVTASTGLAAVNIGGVTINKFSGMGIAQGDPMTVASRVKRNSQSAERWKRTKVLIIDEISMIDGSFLDKLEFTARHITKDPRPFGGIQVVLTGDFFQLPPVPDRNGPPPRFCFQADCWARSIQKTILLVQVFRQKDNEFVELLNCLRLGVVNDKMSTVFKSLSRDIHYEDGIQPTELFCTRYEVDQANSKRLLLLPGKVHEFEAIDIGNEFQKKALDNLMAVKKLVLKEEAQVMMIKNKDDTLVNGTVGKVVTFLTATIFTFFKTLFRDHELSDGATIEQLKMISSIIGTNEIPREVVNYANGVHNKDKFMQLANYAIKESRSSIVPLVKFSTVNGSRLDIVEREEFSLDNDQSETGASRSQLPLLLSWALSIHKSQGQTLDRVKVDLTRVFEAGQVYVALSRAVSKDRLQLINFNKDKIRSSGLVKTFYDNLQSL